MSDYHVCVQVRRKPGERYVLAAAVVRAASRGHALRLALAEVRRRERPAAIGRPVSISQIEVRRLPSGKLITVYLEA